MMGLSDGERISITFSRVDTVHASDRRSDGRTDRQTDEIGVRIYSAQHSVRHAVIKLSCENADLTYFNYRQNEAPEDCLMLRVRPHSLESIVPRAYGATALFLM